MGGAGVSVVLALGDVVGLGVLAVLDVPVDSDVAQEARAESSNTATARNRKKWVGL